MDSYEQNVYETGRARKRVKNPQNWSKYKKKTKYTKPDRAPSETCKHKHHVGQGCEAAHLTGEDIHGKET